MLGWFKKLWLGSKENNVKREFITDDERDLFKSCIVDATSILAKKNAENGVLSIPSPEKRRRLAKELFIKRGGDEGILYIVDEIDLSPINSPSLIDYSGYEADRAEWIRLRDEADKLIVSMVGLETVEQIMIAYNRLESIDEKMRSTLKYDEKMIPDINFDRLLRMSEDWDQIKKVEGIFTKRKLKVILQERGCDRWDAAPEILYCASQQNLVRKVTSHKYEVVSNNNFLIGPELNNDPLFSPWYSRAAFAIERKQNKIKCNVDSDNIF